MRRSATLLFSLSILSALAALLAPRSSRAESWCAYPLWAHEWGVQVFSGGHATRAGADASALPGYFHDAPAAHPAPSGSPVRAMDRDYGERELPVLHFYAAGGGDSVPLGLEVGFAQGDATSWYPQVDARRTSAVANGAAARTARQSLLAARTARSAGRGGPSSLLPADPTSQLEWDRLTLTTAPQHARAAAPATAPWVDRLRSFPDALWVNGASESERFVFYEARTTETPAVRLERGPTYATGRRHVLLHNVSRAAVFDVFLVHREGTSTYVFYAPSIPAGASSGLVLEDHAVTGAALAAATRAHLRTQLVDAQQPSRPTTASWGPECVMMRDPAVPVTTAEGHRLYANEADALLEVWGARFFDAQGTTIVYREDVHTLDAVMPLSLYTDMYHFVQLRRAGLVLVEGAQLP